MTQRRVSKAGRVISPAVYAAVAFILYPDPDTHIRRLLGAHGYSQRLYFSPATLRVRGARALFSVAERSTHIVACGPVVAALDDELLKPQTNKSDTVSTAVTSRVVPRKGKLAASAQTDALFLPQVGVKPCFVLFFTLFACYGARMYSLLQRMLASMGVTLVLVCFIAMLLISTCSSGASQLRTAGGQIQASRVSVARRSTIYPEIEQLVSCFPS